MLLIGITSLSVAIGILLLFTALMSSGRKEPIKDRLNSYLTYANAEVQSIQDIELTQPFSERIIFPMIKRATQWFSWVLPQNRWNALQIKLAQAGNPGQMNPADFAGLKGLSACVFLTVCIGYGALIHYPFGISSMIATAAAGSVGFIAPDFWLARKIKRRQTVIIHTLPDAIDLLTITIEAGLSFDSGIQEIVAKWDNEFGHEFARMLRDIGMGQTRRRALLALGERTGVADMTSFITAINQADELGVSIARILRIQSEDLRVKRRQRAQERANQAPIKMMFPLVFLIFPAIFAVLLGPALPQLVETFGGL